VNGRTTMRIAVAGIHIESSTFTLHVTRLDDFTVLRGQRLLDSFDFAGWLGDELNDQIEWVPIVHAITGASGPVAPDVYDALEAEIVAGLVGDFDGVYIPFHGAMNVLGRERAEERLVRAIRTAVGERAVLSASMDPHGNLSRELAELLDLAACHRHAPHIDNVQTRERAVVTLVDAISRGEKPLKAWARIPVLLPGERTSTVVEPGATVFGRLLPAIERHRVVDANLWIGFAWADEERNSAAVLVTGYDPAAITTCAAELADAYWAARDDFVIVTDHSGTLDEGLDFVEAGAATPVFISDSGDNVTAGGTGDVTFALRALLGRPALLASGRRFLFAGFVDRDALATAVAAGEGATLELAVGAALDSRYGAAVDGVWCVERLITGPGGRVDGALLTDGPVSVTVQWARDPFVDPADPAFPSGVTAGVAFVDPGGYDVVVVKNGYQFPSQLAHAGSSFMALTPGGTDLDFDRLPIARWSRPMFPLDRAFSPDLTPVIL